jgi:hypothetical protein
MNKRDRLRILLLSGVVFAVVLIVDDLWLHFLGDLSWIDGYNLEWCC